MQNLNVYEIAPGRFALGIRGSLAQAVIERVRAYGSGRGRPSYRGIRGRRPVIDQRFKRVPADKISQLMRDELTRVAQSNAN